LAKKLALRKEKFGPALKSARDARGVSMNRLANELMEKHGAGKGTVSNISRLEKGVESPSEARVYMIADALANLAGDSALEKDRLLKELMLAAGIGVISDTEQIDYLRRKAARKLLNNSFLKDHEIQTILSYISIPTLKRLAEINADDNSVAELLNDIAIEVGEEAQRSIGKFSHTEGDTNNIIQSGRITILIDGEITREQKDGLRRIAAGMMSLLH
jgi:transcriptional regulator with XRE-family HTH domain